MIKIKNKLIPLLRESIKKHRPNLLWVVDTEELIQIDETLGNALRDAISDELSEVGFDGEEPNAVGLKLEELIDEIGNLFIK